MTVTYSPPSTLVDPAPVSGSTCFGRGRTLVSATRRMLAAALEGAESLLERIQSPLHADRVSLAEHSGLDCIRCVVLHRRLGEGQRPLALGEGPKRVAESGVDSERSVREP